MKREYFRVWVTQDPDLSTGGMYGERVFRVDNGRDISGRVPWKYRDALLAARDGTGPTKLRVMIYADDPPRVVGRSARIRRSRARWRETDRGLWMVNERVRMVAAVLRVVS